MEEQVEQAVNIVYNPAGSNQDYVRQALEFLAQVKDSPEAWTVCLALFIRQPKPSDVVRLYTLEVVNTAIKNRPNELGGQNLVFLKDSLMEYLRRNYQPNSDSGPDNSAIQGKLIQTITYLFTALYTTSWTTFFDELLELTKVPQEGNGGQLNNLPGIVIYLRVMTDIHDEIAETTFYRTTEQTKKNMVIKDFIRDNDMSKLVTTWQEILTQWRNVNAEVVERVLHVFAKWVSWIDISLVVNETFLGQLAELLQSPGTGREVTKRRKAATETLGEIAGKGMKPNEKLELIGFLGLTDVVKTLISLPEMRDDTESDEDIDFAEAVAALVNRIVLDLVRMLDNNESGLSPEGRQTAENLLSEWVPFLLLAFRHEFDDVSILVHPSLTELLSYLRKEKKVTNTLIPSHHVMLEPTLEAVVRKMKYDTDLDWDETDPHMEAEFQELRKRIKTLQDALASTDIGLYSSAISALVVHTLENCRQGVIDWRDLELALYQMFLFGEVAVKANGLYLDGQPNGVAAEALVVMMAKMMELGANIYSHPATKLLYIENVVRYSPFFEYRKDFVAPALEMFIQCTHDSNLKVKTRSWYLFLRAVKALRADVSNVASQIITSIQDLLAIKAVIGAISEDEDEMSSDDGSPTDAVFNSQLYLFEAVGSIASTTALSPADQKTVLQTILSPLFLDVETGLEAAKRNDPVAILQIHHDIMAMGTFAKGFADGLKVQSTTPEDRSLATEFQATAEGIVSALENLKASKLVREAASFAFARMVNVLGISILRLLPRWIEGLLAENSSKAELSIFLRLLEQLIHGFKKDIYDYLDQLLTPLCSKVFQTSTQPTTGTDDQLETGELKREYLNFLFAILNNDLSAVFMSPANQPNFPGLLETVEHFAKDVSDPHAERLAIALMTRMSSIWGGPEIPETILPEDKKRQAAPSQKVTPQDPVPGFDRFMITFSEICWSVPANSAFDVRDAQSRLVLGEVAALQKVIYGRTGPNFVTYLRGTYFPSINFPEQAAEEYLSALQRLDNKNFKKFFQNFVLQSVGG